MGGDAVFNDSNMSGIYWGTVGFIASNVTIQLNNGSPYNYSNVCISCEHVLGGAANAISTVAYPQSMTFKRADFRDWCQWQMGRYRCSRQYGFCSC